MISYVEYAKYTIRVRVLRQPEIEIEGDVAPAYRVGDFIKEFRAVADTVRAPLFPVSSEDYGIARNLLKKYGREKLLVLAEMFWRRYSSPVFEDASHVLRLFAARAPVIEREL